MLSEHMFTVKQKSSLAADTFCFDVEKNRKRLKNEFLFFW